MMRPPRSAAIRKNSIGAPTASQSLKADFLSRIGKWASAVVPPLGALWGFRFAETCEDSGAVIKNQLQCQRCETIVEKKAVPWVCSYCGHHNPSKSTKSPGTPSTPSTNANEVGSRTKRKRKVWTSLKEVAATQSSPASNISADTKSSEKKDQKTAKKNKMVSSSSLGKDTTESEKRTSSSSDLNRGDAVEYRVVVSDQENGSGEADFKLSALRKVVQFDSSFCHTQEEIVDSGLLKIQSSASDRCEEGITLMVPQQTTVRMEIDDGQDDEKSNVMSTEVVDVEMITETDEATVPKEDGSKQDENDVPFPNSVSKKVEDTKDVDSESKADDTLKVPDKNVASPKLSASEEAADKDLPASDQRVHEKVLISAAKEPELRKLEELPPVSPEQVVLSAAVLNLKEPELQVEEPSKGSELQVDEPSKESKLQVKEPPKEVEIQDQERLKESELQVQERPKESDLQAPEPSKEFELPVQGPSKEHELQRLDESLLKEAQLQKLEKPLKRLPEDPAESFKLRSEKPFLAATEAEYQRVEKSSSPTLKELEHQKLEQSELQRSADEVELMEVDPRKVLKCEPRQPSTGSEIPNNTEVMTPMVLSDADADARQREPRKKSGEQLRKLRNAFKSFVRSHSYARMVRTACRDAYLAAIKQQCKAVMARCRKEKKAVENRTDKLAVELYELRRKFERASSRQHAAFQCRLRALRLRMRKLLDEMSETSIEMSDLSSEMSELSCSMRQLEAKVDGIKSELTIVSNRVIAAQANTPTRNITLEALVPSMNLTEDNENNQDDEKNQDERNENAGVTQSRKLGVSKGSRVIRKKRRLASSPFMAVRGKVQLTKIGRYWRIN